MPRRARAPRAAKTTEAPEPTPSASPVDFVDGLRSAAIESILVDEIDLSDETFQYRLSTETNGLRDAISREGQLEPIDLADSKPYRIIDGFRRLRAIRELGWPSVRAIVRRGFSVEAMHRIAFAKNVVRKNLGPIEKANAIRLARVRGCTPELIAKQFGVSDKQIRRYDALLNFPKPLQQVVDSGALSMAHATVLARHADIDIADWVKQARSGGWSAAELSRTLRKTLKLHHGGKHREYIRVSDDEVRGYSWRLNGRSNPAEIEGAIAAHKRALNVLQKLLELSPRTPNSQRSRRTSP